MSYTRLHQALNRLLPHAIKSRLRDGMSPLIPSLRHLDMAGRLRNLRAMGFEPDSILDVGAASGDWVRMAAGIWPEAKLFGIEPNEAERENLDATQRDFPRFDFVFGFAGPEAKTVAFDPSGHQTTLASVGTEGKQSALMHTIDGLVDEGRLASPRFIKADVQGYELEVLRGASRTLKDHTEAVLLEVSFFQFEPSAVLVQEVVAFMHEAGFSWFDVVGILRREEDDALGQMDLLFLKSDHPIRSRSDAAW